VAEGREHAGTRSECHASRAGQIAPENGLWRQFSASRWIEVFAGGQFLFEFRMQNGAIRERIADG
jgi:hypothetical protein